LGGVTSLASGFDVPVDHLSLEKGRPLFAAAAEGSHRFALLIFFAIFLERLALVVLHLLGSHDTVDKRSGLLGCDDTAAEGGRRCRGR